MTQYYDKQLDSDLLKPKRIIVASIGKVAFNAGGINTAHSMFQFSYNSSKKFLWIQT